MGFNELGGKYFQASGKVTPGIPLPRVRSGNG